MTQAVAVQNHVDNPVPMRVDEVVAQVALIQEIMRSVMREGEHYGKIPGCGTKPSLLKPGAEKIMLTFRLVADPEVVVVDLPHPSVQGHREYRLKVKLYARDGSYLGGGVGNCSTMEGKYRYRTGPVEWTDRPVPKAYWDLRKSDPVKAQELLGTGHIAKKNDAGTWVVAVQGQKVEHDNPADYYNTCEKMAKKRALVDATLTVTAASDIFTQDLEDLMSAVEAKAEPATDKVERTHDANEATERPATQDVSQSEPSDPAESWRAKLRTAHNQSAINEVWRQIPDDVKQDCYSTYTDCLKAKAKLK
jgi:hypothetical protein